MEEGLLRELADEYLVPFFSGAYLESKAEKSTALSNTVVLVDPVSIAFKINQKEKYRLILKRRQPFTGPRGNIVREIDVVRAFVDVIRPMAEELNGPLKRDLLSTFQRKVVAKAVSPNWREEIILSGIDQLTKWGTKLYERAPIAAAIGFRMLTQQRDGIHLDVIGQNDFGAVLSNGYDSLLEFDYGGNLVGHRALSSGVALPSFCPIRQAQIAEWTTKDERRVALTLNRIGEILIFRDQRLLFARRSGRWSFLTHEPVITQMGTPKSQHIRRAVYETCLDASFARTGACIGIVSGSAGTQWHKLVAEVGDRLCESASPKTRAIMRIVHDRRFQSLDRRLRQELAAIDGAIVLANTGEMLAVGAILRIPGGSTGGGRLAAAKALSELGLGIKVSQDGGITGFRLGKKEAAFRIM